MKLSQAELDRLEKVCQGLKPDLVKSIVSTYYKEKMRTAPKINKSYSYKQENKLSTCKDIQSLLTIVADKRRI